MWKRVGTLAGTAGGVILAVLGIACNGSNVSSGHGTDSGPTGTECFSPADCPSSAPICCGTIQLGQSGDGCGLVAELSTCTTSCTISEQPSACPIIQTAELCSVASDCTDPNYPACCSVGFNGGGPGRTATFCLSATNAAILQSSAGSSNGAKANCL